MNYTEFINRKTHLSGDFGFDPIWMPDSMFQFQSKLVEWGLRKGRGAIFADCGLGKSLMQLVWSENVVRKTAKPVIILTPLAVGAQTVLEAEKFGMEACRSTDGKFAAGSRIVITNYERLHYFDPDHFAGAVCDESAILKNYDGVTKAAVTDFMRKLKYRLLCTATAAPNDFIELGTSSEALGDLGYSDMLSRFFKKSEKTLSRKDENRSGIYRFRGHSEQDFWRWVCSWARAVRKPSDMGCSDTGFDLPELSTRQHVVKARTANPEFLFDMPAAGLAEQRQERSRSTTERCEMAAELHNSRNEPGIAWCYLNREGDLLKKLIPGSVQISGDDSDERKEEVFMAFVSGEIQKIVTKPTIAGSGMNFQHCAHQTLFPSHSFEQYYQCIRRSWRFGQKRPVTIDVITSEGEANILQSISRKAEAAECMFEKLVSLMNNELRIEQENRHTTPIQKPSWIQ